MKRTSAAGSGNERSVSSDETVAQALHTLDQLMNVFNFPLDLANRAVNAIQNKSDITLAYNYCLDHGGIDAGGPVVPKRFCPHLRHHDLELSFDQQCDYNHLNSCQHDQCSDNVKSSEENWICLGKGCGKVLCSRYVRSHALAHYDEELRCCRGDKHCVVLSLADVSVWCYKCNAYLKHQSLDYILKHLKRIKFRKKSGVDEISLPPNFIRTGLVYRESSICNTQLDIDQVLISPSQYAFDLVDKKGITSQCLAIDEGGIETLVDMILNQNGTFREIRNGFVLLDDARDPISEVDNVAKAAFYALYSYASLHRILIIDWGLYEGSGKRIYVDTGEFEDILELREGSNDDGVKRISCTLDATYDKKRCLSSYASLRKSIRAWCPQLIFVRAGFWGAINHSPSTYTSFLKNLEEISMPTAKGRIIFAISTGGRPPLQCNELEVSANAVFSILECLVISL